ncbi:MAG: SCO family protein [Sinimarinibacterium sp.]|jgi:protein SCO1/2
MKRRTTIAAFLAALCMPILAVAAEPPADSIYQLQAQLTDQSGRVSGLDVFRGEPVLISMFYASCPNACPTLIAAMRRLENRLEPAQRDRLRVLMISIDPKHDTPEKLGELAERHHADLQRWRFTRPEAADVRGIAAVLDIQYRELGDGEFNHSSIVTLLDREGRIVATTQQVLRADEEFLGKLRALIGAL